MLRTMTSAELLAAAQKVAERWPEAELVKNDVGNLTVLDDGEYVAFIDLRTGAVEETA